ncbi:hypothetical protein BH11PSE11_BH11PSE11_20850 [soil metagenome]
MNTVKTKRWNGKIESLSAEYLNRVMEQMLAYGDRVQFSLTRGGQQPHYLVTNTAEKKMAFDGSHLLTPDINDFVSSTTSRIYSLEQIETSMKAAGTKTGTPRASSAGSGSTRVTAAQKLALVDAEKYEYFKSNRASLPAGIGQHTKEITGLMLNGLSAAEAFAEVIKRHP